MLASSRFSILNTAWLFETVTLLDFLTSVSLVFKTYSSSASNCSFKISSLTESKKTVSSTLVSETST
ncbi:hypothetical protein [Mesomycoplasma ovipneumoniae]|uniref:hypothetical protein n=1 Tax=Mesomycoplasma ovipneumoniae TaxID=29562 RepID=UPI00311B3339